jgi:diguanylate cyclase (GGDEF)-like protein
VQPRAAACSTARRVPALIVTALLLATAPAFGQETVADWQRRLPVLSGAERAHALMELTALLNNDEPRQAIAYGDEALAWYAAHPDPGAESRTLAFIAWAHMILSDYPKAIASAETGRDLARQHGDVGGEADAINSLGVIAQRRGEALDAVERFTEALDLYRRLGEQAEIANALGNLGFVFSTGLADYERALAYQLEGLRIRETIGDQSAIALSLNNIGIIYARTHDSDKALEYFEQALELRRNTGAKNRIAATLSNISDVYVERDEYGPALDYQRQTLALRREVGDRGGEAMSLRSIGEIYLEIGNYKDARGHLDEALQIAERDGDKGTVGPTLLALSRASREQGRAQEAQAYANRALAIAGETSGRELRRRALEELAAAEEKAGDYAAALRSYKAFKQEHDRIFDQEKAKRLELLERRFQTERREKEISQLRQVEADHALDAARQRSQRNLVAGSAVLCALVGFGLYRRRVESARLAERLSVTDALTGLKNRRYVLQTIGAETAAVQRRLRAAGADRPANVDLLFLMIDLDKFKAVNDERGHKAGDTLLQQMAGVLTETCRTSDVIARWGGDEFLVVSRFADRQSGGALAERIWQAIAQHAFDLGDGRTLRAAGSIGVAAYPLAPAHVDALTWEQVVAIADQALYMAKSGGSGWVSIAVADTATPDVLRRLAEQPLSHWIAQGVVSAESSRTGRAAPDAIVPRALPDAALATHPTS